MIINTDELNIYEVEALHKEILQEFTNETIFIDMQNVMKVDMSIIQLFISTKKSCLKTDKKFELKNVTPSVLKIFKNCACDFLLESNNG